MYRAHSLHRRYFDPNRIQKSRLLSIKTGGCPEDCGYCSQSAHHKTALPASKLMEIEAAVAEAKAARDAGATRYCMGAAWRGPKDRDMAALCQMVERVKRSRASAQERAFKARPAGQGPAGPALCSRPL